MEYLSKSFLNTNYLSRLRHHLSENYFNNRAISVTYTLAGTALITYNGFQAVFSDTVDSKQRAAAWGIVASGTAFVVAPLANALYHASKDEK